MKIKDNSANQYLTAAASLIRDDPIEVSGMKKYTFLVFAIGFVAGVFLVLGGICKTVPLAIVKSTSPGLTGLLVSSFIILFYASVTFLVISVYIFKATDPELQKAFNNIGYLFTIALLLFDAALYLLGAIFVDPSYGSQTRTQYGLYIGTGVTIVISLLFQIPVYISVRRSRDLNKITAFTLFSGLSTIVAFTFSLLILFITAMIFSLYTDTSNTKNPAVLYTIFDIMLIVLSLISIVACLAFRDVVFAIIMIWLEILIFTFLNNFTINGAQMQGIMTRAEILAVFIVCVVLQGASMIYCFYKFKETSFFALRSERVSNTSRYR